MDFKPRNFNDIVFSPIKASDFKAMLISKIVPNDRPYTSTLKKCNNEKVEQFYEKLLLPNCDGNEMITCEKAYKLFQLWEEGYDVRNSYNIRDKFHHPTREQVDFWLNLFSKDIDEIYKLGLNAVGMGYGCLLNYFRDWQLNQKYERIYSSNDPQKWLELADKNINLFKGIEVPFDIKNIEEKAKTLLSVRINVYN